MQPTTPSKVFDSNILFWRVLGMWPRETSSIYYIIYCVVMQMLFSIIYWFLFTLSLMFTPTKIEIFIAQAMFYFTDLAAMSKVGMVIIKQTDLIKAFKMLDSEEFQGDTVETRQIVDRYTNYYAIFMKTSCVFYHFGGFFLLFYPIIEYLLGWSELELPLCEYYFLSDTMHDKFYIVWVIYQYTGLYIMLLVDVSIDTFISGLILMGIIQFKALNWKFENLDISVKEMEMAKSENKEVLFEKKLKRCLKHYDHVLEYCEHIQDVLDFTNFTSFGTGAATICLTMLAFFMPMPRGKIIFMSCYVITLTMEIFLPAVLGTELHYESQNVTTSAYCSNWLTRSESFKRSLGLLMERANKPVVMTGLKMFTLSLSTFLAIFKMAYSLFTLFRNAQE